MWKGKSSLYRCTYTLLRPCWVLCSTGFWTFLNWMYVYWHRLGKLWGFHPRWVGPCLIHPFVGGIQPQVFLMWLLYQLGFLWYLDWSVQINCLYILLQFYCCLGRGLQIIYQTMLSTLLLYQVHCQVLNILWWFTRWWGVSLVQSSVQGSNYSLRGVLYCWE